MVIWQFTVISGLPYFYRKTFEKYELKRYLHCVIIHFMGIAVLSESKLEEAMKMIGRT